MRTKNFTCPPMNSTRDEPCDRQLPNLGINRLNVSSTFPSSSEPSCPPIEILCFARGRGTVLAAVDVGACGEGSDPPHDTTKASETTATTLGSRGRAGGRNDLMLLV